MPSEVWDDIIYQLPNFNGATVEVFEWISNFIRHFVMDLITYPYGDFWKGTPGCELDQHRNRSSWETNHPAHHSQYHSCWYDLVIQGSGISASTTLTDVHWNIWASWPERLNNWDLSCVKGYFVIISWWRHQMETFSALLAICAGNSPVPGEFPAQRPVTRSFGVFFDLCLS